jgi:outer membrane cobalamin receptor
MTRPQRAASLGAALLLWAAAAATAAPGDAWAQPAPDTSRVVVLDPVVVTVTHLEVLRSRLPNAVSVITREQIRESGAASVLAVVHERVPGVFVTQRGVLGYGVAQGAAGRVTIRGAGSSPNTQVLVMTDGRPQMMGLMGHPVPDTHMSSGVERVEVVRGPASVLYGTSAMGGVVNVITRRQWLPGAGAEGSMSYGTYGTRRLEGAVQYGVGGSSGFTVTGNSYRTDGHRSWSSFGVDNVSVRGSTQLRPGLALLADIAVADLRTFDPGPLSAPRTDNRVDILRGSTGLSLENRSDGLAGVTRVFVNRGRHLIHDGFHSGDYTAGVQLHQGLRLDGGRTLTVGGDARRFGGSAENETTGVDWGSHSADEFGVFAMLHAPVMARVVGTGGARMNHHSAYGLEVAPQLGAAVHLTAGTTLRAHTARGFRSPTLRELYLFPAPTPELRPERAWSHEVSVLQQVGAATSVELAVYRMSGSNLIRTTGAPPNLRLENTGRFEHRGGEVAVTTSPLPRLEIDASWGWLDVGELTQAHPKHQFGGGARYSADRVTLRVGAQHIAGLYGADGARNRLPDYTVVNARIAVRAPGRVTVFAAGENLLDQQYQVMAGYPMPGRGITVGVQARSR